MPSDCFRRVMLPLKVPGEMVNLGDEPVSFHLGVMSQAICIRKTDRLHLFNFDAG